MDANWRGIGIIPAPASPCGTLLYPPRTPGAGFPISNSEYRHAGQMPRAVIAPRWCWAALPGPVPPVRHRLHAPPAGGTLHGVPTEGACRIWWSGGVRRPRGEAATTILGWQWRAAHPARQNLPGPAMPTGLPPTGPASAWLPVLPGCPGQFDRFFQGQGGGVPVHLRLHEAPGSARCAGSWGPCWSPGSECGPLPPNYRCNAGPSPAIWDVHVVRLELQRLAVVANRLPILARR